MRLSALVAMLALAAPCAATETPTIISLDDGGASQSFSGVSSGGAPTKFSLSPPSARSITFTLESVEDGCGVEMQRSSRLGYMAEFDRIPAKLVVAAKQGEVFIISFFQNRAAWIAKSPCSFSFEVE
ncbi:hypothetical protein SAMN03159496_05552 [Rhizobium sp. NFR07]|nr:hypothetical protein SAMN03159496_05552 [Rhizobium sp. NFR07]